MTFLNKIFGDSQAEAWDKIAYYIGAEYIQYTNPLDNVILYHHKKWEIMMDAPIDKNKNRYTRIRLPFINNGDFYFELSSGLLSSISGFLNRQKVVTGDVTFDKTYTIVSNEADFVRSIFSSIEIRETMLMIKRLNLNLQNEAYPIYFAEDIDPVPRYYTDQLYYSTLGVLKNKEQIFYLFKLFSLVIDELVKLEVALNENPGFDVL